MNTIEQLKDIAKEQLVDTMSSIIRHRFKNGDNILYELDNDLRDEFINLANIVAESVVPTRKKDIESILSQSTKEILDSVNLIKELGVFDKDKYFQNEIHKTIKQGIGSLIFNYFIDKQQEIKDEIFIKTCEKVIETLDKSKLDNEDYIINLIEEYNSGWPLIVAKGDLDLNPKLVLLATEKDSWALSYAGKELTSKISTENPIDSLRELCSQIDSNKKNNKAPT